MPLLPLVCVAQTGPMDQTSDEITFHFNRDTVSHKDGARCGLRGPRDPKAEAAREVEKKNAQGTSQPDVIGQLLLRWPEQQLTVIVF